MESLVSRESSFLFNNLILLASCFAVFWGTMFPVFSEAVKGDKITVGPPFFNQVNVPIAIFLMFLTGVGPLLAWRKASTNSLKRNFLWPAVIALAAGVVLYVRGVRHFYAWLSLVMSIFVGDHDRAGVLQRRTSAQPRHGRKLPAGGGESDAAQYAALWRLHRSLRIRAAVHRLVRPGVHDRWQQRDWESATPWPCGNTRFAWTNSELRTRPTTRRDKATVSLFEYGKKVAMMYPERRVYKAGRTAADKRSGDPLHSQEDIYVVFAGATIRRHESHHPGLLQPADDVGVDRRHGAGDSER